MPTGSPGLIVPEIVMAGTAGPRNESTYVLTSASDTHTNAIFPGTFVKLASFGYIACVAADDTAAYQVVHMYRDTGGQQVATQCALKADLETSGAIYRLVVTPVGGCIFRVLEDGVGGSIADIAATPYANLIYANPTSAANNINPTGNVYGSVLIDSSTAHAEATSLSIQMIANDPTMDNIGTKKVIRFKFNTPTQSQ